MAVNESFLQHVTDQLSEFGDFDVKKMFGGIGFFKEGTMFAMIGGDTFRFRVDEITQPDYEVRGMKPFMSKSKKKGMPYWEVPADVLDDKKELKKWADKAYQAALRNKKK